MSTASAVPGPTGPARPGASWGAVSVNTAYVVLLVVCTALSITWLVVGAVVGLAANVPGVRAAVTSAAVDGDRWARGVLEAIPRSEPAWQAVLDYGFSLLSLAFAIALAFAGRSWPTRLLMLALTGAAGAFNLQAHAAATAVQASTGVAIGGLHQVLLHGVACAAYVLGLMLFPPQPRTAPVGPVRAALVLAGAGTLLVVGIGTALLPHTTSCVLFFGFLVPLAGLAVLPARIRNGPTAQARTQARLLFSASAAGLAITIVLAVITVVVWSVGWTGLVMVDPTAHGPRDEPTALLFWFSRLAAIAIAGAVLVAMTGGLWGAERRFSRGLAAALAAALVGGGYLVMRIVLGFALDDDTPQGAFAAAAVTTAVAAVIFLPVYVRAERVVDRLLYGSRPTPYSVLAGIADLSRRTTADAPDLARLAEAVGRGLGASFCRLTVKRTGLRDRAYTWTATGANPSDELVEEPVRHGAEQVGALAVDHAAVAGLNRQRQNLLEDVADSLGVVLQASRVGIELERQLRAALAHANEIALSRRAVVAEMDAERRRIERDLHDGAQHHLVSLRLTLGLAEHQVATGRFEQASGRLEQIVGQLDLAESILAETAAGVSSPLLAKLGLVAALETELAGGVPPVPVIVDPDVTARAIAADVESAVYFCTLEAVNNARKHAPGAAIEVRLRIERGRLRFTVTDDGPGWDVSAGPGSSPGRGVRNVSARIAAVGGRIEIRSRPGAGTTVDGSAPLPEPAAPPAEPVPAEPVPAEPVPTEPAPAESVAALPRATLPAPSVSAGVPLTARVRRAVQAACEEYDGTPHTPALAALGARLDQPMRLAVTGAGGAGADVVAEALDGVSPAVRIVVAELDATAPVAPVAEALVLVIRHDHPEDVARYAVLHDGPGPHRPARALGVLTGSWDTAQDAERAARELAARADVRRLCSTVVPLDPTLVQTAATLTEADYRALRAAPDGTTGDGAGDGTGAVAVGVAPQRPGAVASTAWGGGIGRTVPVTSVGRWQRAARRIAVDLVRAGQAPDVATLAAGLRQRSGAPRLREVVERRFARRAASLTARSVVLALEQLVRTALPPQSAGGALRYELERIRSGDHELVEIDIVDALLEGAVPLPPADREEAARMLGAVGSAPAVRLGLAPDAGREEVAAAAASALSHWRRRALHPQTTAELRDVTEALVRTCEHLLSDARST